MTQLPDVVAVDGSSYQIWMTDLDPNDDPEYN